jgi:hypothetical protein
MGISLHVLLSFYYTTTPSPPPPPQYLLEARAAIGGVLSVTVTGDVRAVHLTGADVQPLATGVVEHITQGVLR